MRILFLLALILSVRCGGFAQQIFFCQDHTLEGKPIGIADTFNLAESGEAVEMVFQNGKPFFSPKLYFFIDRWEGSRFEEYDTKTAMTEHGSTWAALQYRFLRSGAYRVMVLNADKQELCRKQVMVSINEDQGTPEYYNGVQAMICTAAPNGKPLDTLDVYRLRTGQTGLLTVLLRHVQPLGSSRLVVDVWVGAGDGAGVYVETIELETSPEWMHTQFKYEFDSYGVYSFRIYNEQEVFIAATRVSVESR